jgi:SPOR domain
MAEEPHAPQGPAWPPSQHYADPQQGYGEEEQGFYFPQAGEGDPNHAFAPQAGYPPSPAPGYGPQAAAPVWNQHPDPRGFDLGNYMPVQQGYGPPAHDGGHFPAPQGDYDEGEVEYDDTMDDDEPGRGRRGALIAAALVGAIALGGAMAYTYKAFLGTGGGRAPLIRLSDSGPVKIKPDDPGGREFAHTDKKLLNRLGDATPPASEAEAQDDRASEDPNAPRKVRIIPITPAAGTVTTASVPPRPAGGPTPVSVPGVMLEMGPPPAARPPAQSPAAAPRAQTSPPVKVVSAEPPSAIEVAPPPARKPAAAPKVVVPKVKQPSAAAPTSGGSGFVAVLASKKSRMDALKAFADLQQKYGDVLAAKTPDVQEADLGDKGLWYRAVVGPPGSREAATSVCSQLKTAGHAGCWVAAY